MKKNDLISRNALVAKTEVLYQHTSSGKIIPWSAVRVCEINNIPTIDAEPVRHGRWEWYEDWGDAPFRDIPEIYDDGWACSVCGTALLQYLLSHFPDIPSYTECASGEKPTLERCPCCGAKMDAKEDDHAAKETNDLAG